MINPSMIRRIALLIFLGLGLFQVTACDQIQGILDTCESSEEGGTTSVDCSPESGGEA